VYAYDRCSDVHVDYPPSLTEKYIVGEFLTESELSVLKACTERLLMAYFATLTLIKVCPL